MGTSRCPKPWCGYARDFLTLMGGVAVAWPVSARAQPGERVRWVGALIYGQGTDREIAARLAAFRKTLQDLGWTPDANLLVDVRFGVNSDDLREKAKELIGLCAGCCFGDAYPQCHRVAESHPHNSDRICCGHRSRRLWNCAKSGTAWRQRHRISFGGIWFWYKMVRATEGNRAGRTKGRHPFSTNQSERYAAIRCNPRDGALSGRPASARNR